MMKDILNERGKIIMFYVFSYTLKEYLNSNGFTPVVDDNSDKNGTCFNPANERNFWRYIKDQELEKSIKEWELQKSNL